MSVEPFGRWPRRRIRIYVNEKSGRSRYAVMFAWNKPDTAFPYGPTRTAAPAALLDALQLSDRIGIPVDASAVEPCQRAEIERQHNEAQAREARRSVGTRCTNPSNGPRSVRVEGEPDAFALAFLQWPGGDELIAEGDWPAVIDAAKAAAFHHGGLPVNGIGGGR